MRPKITILAFAFLASWAALANAPTSFTITSKTARVYNVNYKSAETGKVKISIFNSANQLVFNEILSNVTSFVRPYNFSSLPEGEYTLVVEDKNGKQAEKVNYAMNKITSIIKVTEIANAENKFLLNITTTGTEIMTVKIYDSENNLVYNQETQVTGSYGLVYNLSQVKSTGNVTFEIATSNGKFETISF